MVAITVGLLVIATVLVLKAIVIVPTVHYGLVTRFKRRTGRVLEEGLNFVAPFIDSVELFKYEVVTCQISESFFSKDKLQVEVHGSVQWRPDGELLDSKFIEMSEETIQKGVVDAVKSELGIIAGTKEAEAFIKSREAISQLINAVLRLGEPPHIKEELKPQKRLQYYIKEAAKVRKDLVNEAKNTEDRSDIEKRYGIDILTFALADVDFSSETKKALEKNKQMEAQLAAQNQQSKKTEDIAKSYKKELGVNAQEALNAAQVTLGQAEKKVTSVEGLGKLFFK